MSSNQEKIIKIKTKNNNNLELNIQPEEQKMQESVVDQLNARMSKVIKNKKDFNSNKKCTRISFYTLFKINSILGIKEIEPEKPIIIKKEFPQKSK
jgi:hypothetical protein